MRRIDPKSMRRADAATTGEAKSKATTAAMSLALSHASRPLCQFLAFRRVGSITRY